MNEEAVEMLRLWNIVGRRLEILLEKYVTDQDGLAQIHLTLSEAFQIGNKLIKAQMQDGKE